MPCFHAALPQRIDTPEFHNIHYIREMLFQVCGGVGGGGVGVVWGVVVGAMHA